MLNLNQIPAAGARREQGEFRDQGMFMKYITDVLGMNYCVLAHCGLLLRKPEGIETKRCEFSTTSGFDR